MSHVRLSQQYSFSSHKTKKWRHKALDKDEFLHFFCAEQANLRLFALNGLFIINIQILVEIISVLQ